MGTILTKEDIWKAYELSVYRELQKLIATQSTNSGNVISTDGVHLIWSVGGGSSLPDPTGHDGEFLTNDGTNFSWAAVSGTSDFLGTGFTAGGGTGTIPAATVATMAGSFEISGGTDFTLSPEGDITIETGSGVTGKDMYLSTGAGTTGIGGAINISPGNSTDNLGGAIVLTSGASSGDSGGAITLSTGAGLISGAITLVTANASADGAGAINITTGNGILGTGGAINLTAGNSTNANGGTVTITGGNSDSSNGGSIILAPGAGDSEPGYVGIQHHSTAFRSYLSTSSLTADHTFTFPNSDGTFLVWDLGVVNIPSINTDGSALNITQTWNTATSPTAIKLNITNTASGASSNLMDLQVGSVSQFKVSKAGVVTSLGDINVPDEVYGAGWDGSLEVPTKNAIYDKIQTLGGGDIVNGGNTGAVVIGTNDTNTLSFETNNVVRAVVTGGASTGGAWTFTNVTANTNTVQDVLTISANSTGTAAASFGTGILFQGENSTTNNTDMARIRTYWTTATAGSHEAAFSIMLGDAGGALAEILKLDRTSATGQLTLGSAQPVVITRGDITTANTFTVGNSSQRLVLSSSSTTDSVFLTNSGISTTGTAGVVVGTTAYTSSTLSKSALRFTDTYTPTTGSGTFKFLEFGGTINQTTGGTGATWGLYLNTTLTSPANYHSIESVNGKIKFTDTQSAGSGSLTGSLLNLAQTWNTSGSPTAIKLNVTNTASGSAAKLLDLQIGGTSVVGVSKGGLIQFGGTTSSFSAIKGSSATLQARLADDSDFALVKVGALDIDGTVSSAADDQTINKRAGSFIIDSGTTSATITNSHVTVDSLVFVQLMTDDATARIKQVVPAAGSFVVEMLVAATAEVKCAFLVINV